MMKLRFFLTWMVTSILLLVLFLFLAPAAQVLLADTNGRQCPTSANSTCPNCVRYLVAYCHQTQTPAYLCQSTPSGQCMNNLQQTCNGVQNGKQDCSDKDSDIPCSSTIFTCDYSP